MNIKKCKVYAILLIVALFIACERDHHFISDAVYRAEVMKQFERQENLAQQRNDALFAVFKDKLSTEEREALKFLYAYMPLSDLADYDGKFYLQNVRMALMARDSFKWGATIPEDIFRHFVLPYRVNNENLDTARSVFFYELKDRLKNMSMKEAALEVNHWCHEKVTYRGTDGRTSSPLNTVKTAYGRCGEESVFTVTAMRSVGIPARQIYTPRWAHSDDNHAWVEVWVDGKWYFMGACEPEPDLNMGWFAGPATRAMLLHTRVFGDYRGNDDVVNKTDLFTEINVLPAYAPSKRIFVEVRNPDNSIGKGIPVEFQLYNYAEFYPIAKAVTDSNGMCSLLTGYGDLIVWAGKDNLADYRKISVGKIDTVKLTLNSDFSKERTETYDIIPPVEGAIVQVSDSGREENNRRLKAEDKLRSEYEKTFIDSASILQFASKLNLNSDSALTYLLSSRGNWQEIKRFLELTKPDERHLALRLLSVISEKDRHDTPAEVLLDHLRYSNSSLSTDPDLFYAYVLNPRISYEQISSYKEFFMNRFGNDFIEKCRKDISVLFNWINENISIDGKANSYRVPLRPKGVYELRRADKLSRDIFFVAVCRSFGIPAQLEAARNIPRVYRNGQWNDVYFEKKSITNLPKGYLTLDYVNGQKFKPEYYLHFTIGKFNGSSYKTLDYEFDNIFEKFPAKLTLDTGKYILVTGIRKADGSVLSMVKFFNIASDKTKDVKLEFRENTQGDDVDYGTIALNEKITLYQSDKQVALNNLATGKGMVIIWIDPDREPTKHLMADITKLSSQFDAWKGDILFLLSSDKVTTDFNPANYTSLPVNCRFAVDQNKFLATVEKATGKPFGNNYPIVLVVKPDGKIRYYSSGYKIGNGEQIVKLCN